jgi:hypothetical protein
VFNFLVLVTYCGFSVIISMYRMPNMQTQTELAEKCSNKKTNGTMLDGNCMKFRNDSHLSVLCEKFSC